MGLENGRIVLHGLQIGGAQSKLFLIVALGVVLRVVSGVVLRVVLRVVLDVATLCSSALHVTSSGSDPATAVFAKMSGLTNATKTTARTK